MDYCNEAYSIRFSSCEPYRRNKRSCRPCLLHLSLLQMCLWIARPVRSACHQPYGQELANESTTLESDAACTVDPIELIVTPLPKGIVTHTPTPASLHECLANLHRLGYTMRPSFHCYQQRKACDDHSLVDRRRKQRPFSCKHDQQNDRYLWIYQTDPAQQMPLCGHST